MIVGIGTDIIDIKRIEKVLDMHAGRFIQRCFTDQEIMRFKQKMPKALSGSSDKSHKDNIQRKRAIETLAKRFAAKEACAKALGTGIAKGVYLKDIGVVNDEHGRPSMELFGGALERLQGIMPEGKTPYVHVSLSDEPPSAKALVIIEARDS